MIASASSPVLVRYIDNEGEHKMSISMDDSRKKLNNWLTNSKHLNKHLTPDITDLSNILQATGFSIRWFDINDPKDIFPIASSQTDDRSSNQSNQTNGTRVILICPKSGIRITLEGSGTETCRCPPLIPEKQHSIDNTDFATINPDLAEIIQDVMNYFMSVINDTPEITSINSSTPNKKTTPQIQEQQDLDDNLDHVKKVFPSINIEKQDGALRNNSISQAIIKLKEVVALLEKNQNKKCDNNVPGKISKSKQQLNIPKNEKRLTKSNPNISYSQNQKSKTTSTEVTSNSRPISRQPMVHSMVTAIPKKKPIIPLNDAKNHVRQQRLRSIGSSLLKPKNVPVNLIKGHSTSELHKTNKL